MTANIALWMIFAYLIALPLIGLWARFRARENSLSDYYLAGGMIGTIPLFFTLYATQYSGNTLFGFAGNAYRNGPVMLFSAASAFLVIFAYLIYGRKMHQLAKQHHFVTIADYIRHRYNSNLLILLLNLVFIFALGSYVLTNFKAVGHLTAQLTDNALAPAYAVFGLAAIMAFYESVGGMRSVVWTDMLQGILLFIGAMGVIISVLVLFENPFVLAQNLVQNPSPSWPPFTARSWMTGFSTLILFGLVIPLYPHVIQRIYAARNIATLRTSFVLLTFTPFFIILPIIVSAMAAGLILPPLAAGETDQVIPRLIDFLAQGQPIMQIFSALFMAAVLAAIMSTMDSAMLSLGAVFNNDFIRPNFPHWSQAKLTRIGRALSWVLMFSMAYAALVFPQDIWSFILLQVDFLAQVFPALAVGVLLPLVRARSVIIGLVTGLLTVLALRYGLISIDTMGIHAGLIGLVLNLAGVIGAHLLDQKNKFA